MATIFNMYKDIATPDVTADIRASRRESEANTKKTQETAFGMLKRSNIVTLQQQYREGKGRFADITDPDKKFQVYYDALKALDPQAAQDAAKVYGEERQRRINREVADAYSLAGSSGNQEIDELRKYIESLKANIASTEALEATREQKQAQDAMQGYMPYTEKPTREQKQAQDAMQGYMPYTEKPTREQTNPTVETQSADETQTEVQDDVPFPKYDLKRMYGFNPEFDISLSREQPTTGYGPMTRNITTMYRGI